jgi:8-oxo-dGTP diphosphatase
MARTPIQAAGGIVLRGGKVPLFAVVQRRRDREWVLPKGKLYRGESAVACARREVLEETGTDVIVHEFIGAISYDTSSAPKVVQFWRMEAIEAPQQPLMKDIRAVEWLPLNEAVKKLSLPREQLFLRNIGPLAQSLAGGTKPAADMKPAIVEARKDRPLDIIRRGLQRLLARRR